VEIGNDCLSSRGSDRHISLLSWCGLFFSCFVAVLGFPRVLYRGVGYSDELLDLYVDNVGQVVYLYNFTSTSRARSVAESFAKKHKERAALMIITVPEEMKGVVGDVSTKSNYKVEQEMLISCNTGFKIEDVDMEQRTIHLTLFDTSRCLTKTKKLCKVSLQPEHL
jgi:hypothetical protein